MFTPDKLDSKTDGTHTYLINVSRNLPVVSLATNPAHLFDDTIGIYVVGTNGRPASCLGGLPANYNPALGTAGQHGDGRNGRPSRRRPGHGL